MVKANFEPQREPDSNLLAVDRAVRRAEIIHERTPETVTITRMVVPLRIDEAIVPDHFVKITSAETYGKFEDTKQSIHIVEGTDELSFPLLIFTQGVDGIVKKNAGGLRHTIFSDEAAEAFGDQSDTENPYGSSYDTAMANFIADEADLEVTEETLGVDSATDRNLHRLLTLVKESVGSAWPVDISLPSLETLTDDIPHSEAMGTLFSRVVGEVKKPGSYRASQWTEQGNTRALTTDSEPGKPTTVMYERQNEVLEGNLIMTQEQITLFETGQDVTLRNSEHASLENFTSDLITDDQLPLLLNAYKGTYEEQSVDDVNPAVTEALDEMEDTGRELLLTAFALKATQIASGSTSTTQQVKIFEKQQ